MNTWFSSLYQFSWLPFVPQEQDGVSVPCFLKDVLIPLVRVGQQLQVLVKLLELCTFVATNDHTYEGFLPCWTGFSGNCPYYSSPLTFIKGNVEAMLLSRDRYYRRMQEKLENLSAKLEFRYQQVIHSDNLVSLYRNSVIMQKNNAIITLISFTYFFLCFLVAACNANSIFFSFRSM